MSPQGRRPSRRATASASNPLPSSSMSITTSPPSTPTCTSTAVACACRATLLIVSWQIRKSAVSISGGSRRTSPNSQRTAIPRDSSERSAYQRIAESSPRSSSTDGRRSRMSRWTSSSVRTASAFTSSSRGTLPARCASWAASMPIASTASPWLVSSCSSRAMPLPLVLLRGDHLAQELRPILLALAERGVRLVQLLRPLLDALLELGVRLGDPVDELAEVLAHPLERLPEAADLVLARARGWARRARPAAIRSACSVRTATGAVMLRAAPHAKTPASANWAARSASTTYRGSARSVGSASLADCRTMTPQGALPSAAKVRCWSGRISTPYPAWQSAHRTAIGFFSCASCTIRSEHWALRPVRSRSVEATTIPLPSMSSTVSGRAALEVPQHLVEVAPVGAERAARDADHRAAPAADRDELVDDAAARALDDARRAAAGRWRAPPGPGASGRACPSETTPGGSSATTRPSRRGRRPPRGGGGGGTRRARRASPARRPPPRARRRSPRAAGGPRDRPVSSASRCAATTLTAPSRTSRSRSSTERIQNRPAAPMSTSGKKIPTPMSR